MAKLNNDKVSMELDLRATKAEEEIHRLTKATKELRDQNAEHRREISRLAATEGDNSKEIKRLNEEIDKNSAAIRANQRAMKEEAEKIDVSRKSAAELKQGLRQLTRDLNNTSKALNPEEWKKTEAQIKKYKEALRQAEAPTTSLWDKFRSLPSIAEVVRGAFLAVGTAITAQVLNAFKQLVATVQDFERANSKLASVLGTNIDGVSRLTEQAKFLGRTTTATASQVTGLQTELAKLGFSQDVIEKLTPATLKFAKAVDTDLSSAAAFAGAAMRMFNKDADEAEEVMASFAVATTKSALDFSKLQASLATVGPVANAFGFSLEETTALLGQLSNAGFDASSAATATRNILLNLADANGDLAKALGGPVTNLDQLVAGLQHLNSEGVDLAKALELTDKRSVAAFSTFLNGADNILSLRDSITGCTGDFNQMAATMADNAAGSWAGFQSAVEGLVLNFFDFREALKKVYEWATEVVNWIGSFVDAMAPLGTMLGAVAAALGYVVSSVGKLVGWFSKLFTQTTAGRMILNTLVATIIAYKTASLLSAHVTKEFVKSLALKAKAMIAETAANIKAAIATRSFNAALMANPFVLVVSLLAMVTAAVLSYNDATEEAAQKSRELNDIEELNSKNREDRIKRSDEMNQSLAVEKDRITELLKIAGNEALAKERREKAVRRLNEICPEYNGYIDAETGALKGATQALNDYLVSLEKKARMEYYRETYEQYVKDIEDGERKLQRMYNDTLQKEVRRRGETIKKRFPELDEQEAYLKAYNELYNEWASGSLKDEGLRNAVSEFNSASASINELKADFSDLKVDMRKAGVDLEDVLTENVTKSLKSTGGAAAETVSRLKEINAELKRLRKIDPQSDEELDRIRKRISLLQEERKELLGKNRTKREPGTYGPDSLDEVTAPVDDAHQKRLLEINKADMSATDKAIAKNRELIKYCDELSKALDELRLRTDSTHTKTLDAINAEQNKLAQQSTAAQQAIDKALVKKDETNHKSRLAATEAFYRQLSELTRASAIVDNDISEAAGVYQMDLERQLHNDQLTELQRYYDEVAAADYYAKDEKTKIFGQLGKEIQQVQSQILTDTGKFSELLREAMTDTTSAGGISDEFARKRNAMTAYYEALKETAAGSADDIAALEQEKNRRLAALNYQEKEQMWQLQEATGLSWADQYERELDKLENMHTQGLINEKEYQQARLQLQVNNAKKYFDFYGGLATSMFTAIQDAEIAKSDAKYDVLIQQAKNNGEDTAALEQEKENKKLEIQKKYADVNFAIKVSQIIADTAVAVMKAWADLGPIGGPIAAAIISATGIAQLVSAKAERDKIKNMQPGNVSAAASTSAKTPTATRTLTGFSEGGYTGPGDRYEVAGVVHRGEYVVPKPIMENPRVIDAVGVIEAVRRNNMRTSGSFSSGAGFADGGYTSAAVSAPRTDPALLDAIGELRRSLASISDIRAHVVYQDIEKAGKRLERARAPFTRS